MANPPRTRKRVRAARRASDGSAFQNCHYCGVSVAIALADMHECEPKKDVKRFKGVGGIQNVAKPTFDDQPRSAFRFFMEMFMEKYKTKESISIDREGFDTWKKMSNEERKPYVNQAAEVNSAYLKTLLEEVDDGSEVDCEVDSVMVGKFDEVVVNGSSDGYETSDCFQSLNTYDFIELYTECYRKKKGKICSHGWVPKNLYED